MICNARQTLCHSQFRISVADVFYVKKLLPTITVEKSKSNPKFSKIPHLDYNLVQDVVW